MAFSFHDGDSVKQFLNSLESCATLQARPAAQLGMYSLNSKRNYGLKTRNRRNRILVRGKKNQSQNNHINHF